VQIPPRAAGGKTWQVDEGDNLQRAIDAAGRGDEIVLAAGAAFEGSYTLPRKAGSGWITIRSGGPIPEDGMRATHLNSGQFARIVATTARPAIRTLPGASGYRLIGLEVTAANALKRINTLIALGDGSFAQNSEEKIPRDLILDRLWIHGHPTLNIRRCVALNSAATAIIESTVEECHDDGFDSQAVWGWNGPGPFLIQNNYLEGSSENVGFGGGVPHIKGLVPSDIIIRRNHIAKPAAWKRSRWLVKNLVEFKNARRVLVEDNLIEGNWLHGQPGYAIVFTPRGENQGVCAAWCTVQDVTMRYNHVRRIGSVLNLAANPDRNLANPAARIRFEHNLFSEINTGVYTAQGRLFLLQNAGLSDVVFSHNTAMGDDIVALFSDRQMSRIEFEDNILGSTKGYGLWSSAGRPQGIAAISFHVQGWRVFRNVFAGPPQRGHPLGNWYVPNRQAVGFENLAQNRLALASRSAFRGRSAGKDPGVDVAELVRRLEGVAQPERPDGNRESIVGR